MDKRKYFFDFFSFSTCIYKKPVYIKQCLADMICETPAQMAEWQTR